MVKKKWAEGSRLLPTGVWQLLGGKLLQLLPALGQAELWSLALPISPPASAFFFIIIFLFSLLLLPSSLLGCVFLPPFCVQCWEWVHDIAALRGTAPAACWWWLEGGPRTAALTAAPQRTRCLLRASMRNGIFLFQTGIDSLLTNENICCWILSVFV